jgi:GT2 family glycosyltransferase
MTSANHQPAASIVIPIHNKAIITQQCLDALLAEADDGVAREILVVDDGSTDRTPAMLAAYGERIRLVRKESALGFAGACNAGAAAARGEFLVLLNNDTIPTAGWLAALVAHARLNPAAAVVGAKLLFPNDTIQHAGVVFGLDREPHHLYNGFPANHPATMVSRRFKAVTAACALFRRGPWEALGGLDTAFHNGWEDVDYCMRLGEAGHEIHYCAESVLYHLESSTRNLLSEAERGNRALFGNRWREKIYPDDIGYYWHDGLLTASYGARYPIQLSVSPLLAGIAVGEHDRLADHLLYDRARQVMILLRNNIVLNVRVQDAEARAAAAEQRLAEVLATRDAMQADASLTETADERQSLGDETAGEAGTAAEVEAAESDPIEGSLVAEAAASPEISPEPDSPPPPEAAQQEAPELPHRIVGMVEAPGRLPDVITDGVLVVSGWILTEAGDATIEAIINGERRGELPYGDARPDAAALYPGFPAGDQCGFSSEIAVDDLPDGMHDLTIRVSASDGSLAELATTFEVDNHAFETGRVIGRVDLPVRGALFHTRETVPVSGWVLAPSGMQSLAVTVDGAPRGRVDYGGLRPDIAKRRRQYPDADHCGFYGSVPLYGLSDGSHDLLVVATANDGRTLELSTRIEVDSASSIDGGVPVINRHYRAWLQRRSAPDQVVVDTATDAIGEPRFEVFVPLRGECADMLEALAASVGAQNHSDWCLTLVAAGDASDTTRHLARELAGSDDRIGFQETADTTLTAALNEGIARSNADWVGIVEPGVILASTAFARIARAIGNDVDVHLVYSDDDRIDPEAAERWNPFFKPDWSPDLFMAMNYLGPLTLFRRETALECGGLRDGAADAAVYDLALRLTDRPNHVVHVAEVLVTTIETAPGVGEHWQSSDWRDGERVALQSALARRGIEGSVERGLHPGKWRVRYALPEPLPGVTAVIPTGGKIHLLRPCLDDLLERTDYPNLDILLVDNSGGDEVEHLVTELTPRHPNVRRIVNDTKPFNYPALVNAGVAQATTPYLLMLNDDITVIEPGWLRAMMEHAQRPEVGIVGAKLLYPDDTIQHAGVILGPFGGSVHVFKRFPGDDPGFFDLPDVVRNCSAVTFACAMIDRQVFDDIGGLDAEHLPVAFNDTDFCLRAREAGYEVIYTPHATLYHHESVTKTVIAHPHEIAFLRNRWGHVIDHDPFYNPNLTRQGEDARLNMEASSAA